MPSAPPVPRDPKLLLNPKASNKGNTAAANSNNSQQADGLQHLDRGLNGQSNGLTTTRPSNDTHSHEPKRFLEDLYGVEQRVAQPRKRTKIVADNDDTLAAKNSFQHRSTGIVGDYMKPDPQANVTPADLTVDLTKDQDEDDEVKIIGSRELYQEVCFGQLTSTVLAWSLPKPKDNTKFVGDGQWPTMKCTLRRKPSQEETNIIEVSDPWGYPFARISSQFAAVLAPVMDGLRNLRTQARLLNRRRKPDEWPHQPCSDEIKMLINVYGRKHDADKIGRFFGQRNIWFTTPLIRDPNVPLENPHARKETNLTTRENGRRSLVSDTRTVEEATHAVSRLFDYAARANTALPSTDAPDIITTPLLEHQKQALTFMLAREQLRKYGDEEAENSSLWRKKYQRNKTTYEEVVSGVTLEEEPEEVYGGLLADVMGLGKTIEALALIASTLGEATSFGREKVNRKNDDDALFLENTKATLLVSPLSTIKNWEDQIAEHVRPKGLRYCVYHGPNREDNPLRLAGYDIVLTTYGTIAAEFSTKTTRERISPLKRLKWFRIMLDEAHTIREQRAGQSQAIFSIWAQRRWCLTGTPIQNRIDDLGSLTRFLRLFPYDTAADFNQYIRAPAQSGDASFLKSLRVFVDSFTLRRLRDQIDLPKREDLVESLQFSTDEKRLHDFFKERSQIQIEKLTRDKSKASGLQHHVLQGIMTLRLICAHGRELLKEKDLAELQGTSVNDAIDIEDLPTAPTISKREAFDAYSLRAEADLDVCQNCDKPLSGDSPSAEAEAAATADVRCVVLPCLDVVCVDCFSRQDHLFSNPDHHSEGDAIECPFCQMAIAPHYIPITTNTAQELETPPETLDQAIDDTPKQKSYYGPHTKTLALLRDIQAMQSDSAPLVASGEPPLKCIVFSEFTSHLDLIGRALTAHNHSYIRIDGTMSLSKRKAVMDALNTDATATILLASIKAAGQGLNLTAASRAFIMEPMWNPAAETQAVDRIYRIGQKRAVQIKRYHMAESIEGKIVELQRRKQALADISMNRNHEGLSKKELREKHFQDIRALFK